MHATSTVHGTSDHTETALNPAPIESDRRSFARTFTDLKTGFANHELWAHLGWQDIKQRYRRSVIGPFWITIATGVMALGLGILYSALFHMKIETFLPYITTGFIVWNFILACITEGAETFIANEGMIKQMTAPLTVYVLRTVWRQVLMLAHNLIIYVIVLLVSIGTLGSPYHMSEDNSGPLHPGLGFGMLLVIPGFILLVVSGVWVSLLFGIISTRFRDIPQVINSLVQLVFYMTPIVWSPDVLGERGRSIGHTAVQFNPLYHYVQVVRGPLLGQQVGWWSWVIVVALTGLGWGTALLVMKNYRSRVSYWV